jgi:hypothetical protein
MARHTLPAMSEPVDQADQDDLAEGEDDMASASDYDVPRRVPGGTGNTVGSVGPA